MYKTKVLVGVISGGLLAFSAAVAPAGGGGGGACGGPKTEGSGTEVALQEICFQPTILYIAPGQAVTWTNQDSVPHTVTSATFVWENRTLDQGNSLRVAFEEPGIYPYFCLFHSYMGGAVVVGELNAEQQAFLAALEGKQEDFLTSFDEREKQQQETLATTFDEKQEELKRSLLQGGWAQAGPILVALAALGGGVGGAALTLALRRKS